MLSRRAVLSGNTSLQSPHFLVVVADVRRSCTGSALRDAGKAPDVLPP